MSEGVMGGLDLKNLGGLRLGLRVRIQGIRPELLLALLIVSDLCRVQGLIAVVTSILDSLHMQNSLHYVGAAFDFVIDLTSDRDPWVIELRERLGISYDVIDEGTHIHVEYQVHNRADN